LEGEAAEFMQRYFGRIVRAVIVSLFGFGGGVGLLAFIAAVVIYHDPHPFVTAIKTGFGLGMVFGILLVCVFLPLDLTAHLFLAKGKYREIWDLEQTRELLFDGTLKELTGVCRQALLAVPAVKRVNEDLEHLLIRASTGITWKSPGENMEVEINPVAENQWKLRCTSSSISTNVVFDYAKNFENVEAWSTKMNSLVAEKKRASAS
jgi:hypothetical protein